MSDPCTYQISRAYFQLSVRHRHERLPCYQFTSSKLYEANKIDMLFKRPITMHSFGV